MMIPERRREKRMTRRKNFDSKVTGSDETVKTKPAKAPLACPRILSRVHEPFLRTHGNKIKGGNA